MFASLSSLSLSPSSFRPISYFFPIVAQAAFYHSPHKLDIDRRRASSMTLFPITPLSSSTSATGKYSTPTGSCLRRSNRVCNMNRKGVRLFQETSFDAEIEGESSNDGLSSMNIVSADISNDDMGSTAPLTRSKKRVTRSTSNSGKDSGRVATKTRKAGVDLNSSTPSRGSSAIPITPEPVGGKNSSGSTRPSTKETKAAKVKRKTRVKAKTTTKTKKRTSRAVVTWPEPDRWRETYELVRELRKDKTAPCDIMGAEALGLPARKDSDKGNEEIDEESAKTSRFQILIALMLSSQTKDAMVGQAMDNLKDTRDGSGGLTIASILEMDPKILNSKIYSVGFRNNKTKYIKQVVQILHDNFNDDVPPTADEMIRELPGVGPKMAYIIENICWDKQTGIGVDTHMQRLFPKLGWVSPDTKNPEQTRKQLESWLPHEYWGEVNLLWVGFGQEVQQEKQKTLRKALQSDRPFEALRLLRSVDFDVVSEWEKMQSMILLSLNKEKNRDLVWIDDNGREKINKMIQKIVSQK